MDHTKNDNDEDSASLNDVFLDDSIEEKQKELSEDD